MDIYIAIGKKEEDFLRTSSCSFLIFKILSSKEYDASMKEKKSCYR